jgi:hypothetical protein
MTLTPAKWQVIYEEGDERMDVRREAGGRLFRISVRTTENYIGWRTVALASLPDEPEQAR